MSDLVKADKGELARLASMDTVALRAELSRALKLTVKHLLYLAAIWSELTKRGEDLSHLRVGFVSWIPAIAAGTVLPELVVMFAGERNKLRNLSQLPITEQQSVVDGDPVPAKCLNVGGGRPKGNAGRPVTYNSGLANHREAVTPGKTFMESVASAGGPQDVADMIMGMVRANQNPHDLAERLSKMLATFLKKRG